MSAAAEASFDVITKNTGGMLRLEDAAGLVLSLGYRFEASDFLSMPMDKAAFLELAERLHREELLWMEAQRAFAVFDRDGNGFVNENTLKTALLQEGLTEKEWDRVRADCSKDADQSDIRINDMLNMLLASK